MTFQQSDIFSGLAGPDLDERSFRRISEFAYKTAGLSIAPTKSAMVRTRLAKRLRVLKMSDFSAYCDYVLSDDGRVERDELISALTTNVSHFFREDHHFALIKQRVLPDLTKDRGQSTPIRFWSAGCSNGQEPLSLAMTLEDYRISKIFKDVKILATDIDPKVIEFARRCEYPQKMLDGLTAPQKERHFKCLSSDSSNPVWTAKDQLRALITYRQLNLLNAWPMKGKFDAIFCRNVVIYFDQKTQDQLWEKIINVLNHGGWLFLGHSERISEQFLHQFETQGSTAYRLIR